MAGTTNSHTTGGQSEKDSLKSETSNEIKAVKVKTEERNLEVRESVSSRDSTEQDSHPLISHPDFAAVCGSNLPTTLQKHSYPHLPHKTSFPAQKNHQHRLIASGSSNKSQLIGISHNSLNLPQLTQTSASLVKVTKAVSENMSTAKFEADILKKEIARLIAEQSLRREEESQQRQKEEVEFRRQSIVRFEEDNVRRIEDVRRAKEDERRRKEDMESAKIVRRRQKETERRKSEGQQLSNLETRLKEFLATDATDENTFDQVQRDISGHKRRWESVGDTFPEQEHKRRLSTTLNVSKVHTCIKKVNSLFESREVPSKKTVTLSPVDPDAIPTSYDHQRKVYLNLPPPRLLFLKLQEVDGEVAVERVVFKQKLRSFQDLGHVNIKYHELSSSSIPVTDYPKIAREYDQDGRTVFDLACPECPVPIFRDYVVFVEQLKTHLKIAQASEAQSERTQGGGDE